jgi:hypothetical protein
VTNDIHALHPEPRKAAQAFIAELRDKKIRFKVTSTHRETIEQIALYCQHRASLEIVNLIREYAKMYLITEKANTGIVTNANGLHPKSDHQNDNTLDVVPVGCNGNPIWPPPEDSRWLEMGVIGERHGFMWGGRWAEPDPAHYTWRPA